MYTWFNFLVQFLRCVNYRTMSSVVSSGIVRSVNTALDFVNYLYFDNIR